MRQNHVFHEKGFLFWETIAGDSSWLRFEFANLLRDQLDAHHQVPDQTAFHRVFGDSVISEFPEFTDVVEKSAQEQKVSVQVFSVVSGQMVECPHDRNHVLDHSAFVSVVNALCGGGALQAIANVVVVAKHGFSERAVVRIFHGRDVFQYLLVKRVHIERAFGDVIFRIHFIFAKHVETRDHDLTAPEIKLAAAFHPNKRIANGLTCVSRSIFPDPGLKLTRLIHQN